MGTLKSKPKFSMSLIFVIIYFTAFLFQLSETRDLVQRDEDFDQDDEEQDDEDQDDTSGKVTIGSFRSYAHDLGGEVTLLDEKTIEITGLNYDGAGPAAWFMIGNTDRSSLPEMGELDGTVIPDDNEGY